MEYKENHTATKISASVEVNDGLVNQRTYQISIEATPQTHTYQNLMNLEVKMVSIGSSVRVI